VYITKTEDTNNVRTLSILHGVRFDFTPRLCICHVVFFGCKNVKILLQAWCNDVTPIPRIYCRVVSLFLIRKGATQKMTQTQTQTHREVGDVRHLGKLFPLRNVDYSLLFLVGLNYFDDYLHK